MKQYDPRNWYWIVAGDETKVYSSVSGDYVPVADATYAAWTADGTPPSRIASEAELGEVLSQHALRPAHAGVLDGYKDTQAKRLTIEIVAKILLWCVNEIRSLKGQASLNAGQFRAFIKDQL